MNKEQETSILDQPNNDDRIEEFDDYIDEITPPIIIAGIHIVPSNALYECDPIAYRIHSTDFLDAMHQTD
jgi:hypothetical protein